MFISRDTFIDIEQRADLLKTDSLFLGKPKELVMRVKGIRIESLYTSTYTYEIDLCIEI